MNFEDTLLAAELIIQTNEVPLIVGQSGIGKTALAKELANKNNWSMFIIDGNLLKEGEIGGLPTVDEYKYLDENKLEHIEKRTVYAVHTKLQQIQQAINSGKEVLLFIDEINRCEHTVQQELMNLILNKEINGYNLHESVKLLAAMNPSSKYEDDFDYQVIDMDPAQENRFVWLEMESNVENWIQWAINNKLEEKVIEFISTFPEYLHSSKSSERIKATPRSFERVSKSYKLYKEESYRIPKKIFFNILKGNVGSEIAQEFMAFIESSTLPLITYKEVFDEESLSEDVIFRLKKESHTRLYLTIKNILISMENNEISSEKIQRLVEFIGYYPVDLKIGIMKDIKGQYKNIYKECLKNNNFIEGYFKAYTSING
ncbi:ATP-binding protein [Clostridium sp. ATCC 25772]|uniref:ATP-binding protein n=1 Tax=Clostridium sp. ATCC 25772 TaxID=1676991 RepID=UPI0007813BC6|nr:ATP-binding protein [Clostridium sp. ATCC 25772]